MKLPKTIATITASVVTALFSGVACAQLTSPTYFPSSGDGAWEPSRPLDFPSITHRYGNDNPYSRWRATGEWDVWHVTGRQDNQSTVPPTSGKNEAGRPPKQDGYAEPIKR